MAFHELLNKIIFELNSNNGSNARGLARCLKFEMWESNLRELSHEELFRTSLKRAMSLAKLKSGTTYVELSNILNLINVELKREIDNE